MIPASHAAGGRTRMSQRKTEPNGRDRRFMCVLTRLVLQLVRLLLFPLDAAGPSRSRLYLHRARLVLRDRIG